MEDRTNTVKRKRKRILLISLLLVCLGGSCWFYATRPDPVITVKGDLSDKDVAEIKRIVNRERLRRVFPGFSWANIKQLPGAIRDYPKGQIDFIKVQSPGPIDGIVFNPAKSNQGIDFSSAGRIHGFASSKTLPAPSLSRQDTLYFIEKGTNGWRVGSIMTGRFSLIKIGE
jgi:hypothetical protein